MSGAPEGRRGAGPAGSAGEAGRAREPRKGRRTLTLGTDHLWPTAIALFLATVVAVNMVFIWIAVSGADEVVPSYVTGER